MCYVSPLSRGANILHQPVHLAIPGLLGPQWAIGATIWNTSRSSHLRTLCVPTEPIGANIYQNFIHQAIQGVVVPQWAVGATVWAASRSLQFWTFCVHNQLTLRQWHMYQAIQCVMCPQWALGATILQHHVHPVTLGPLVLQWVLGATIWTTSRSIHFQTFYVPNEP